MNATQEATKLALLLADKLQRREPPRPEELEKALDFVLNARKPERSGK